ncbi:MAG TPA: hypothetical protein VFV63_10430 [Ilumatobacteraceae bacterium]|nr:hypothetical protein [Ilumatobacteraceae bacterium]
MTSSLERHYARSTFLVAGVGVLATPRGGDTGIDATGASPVENTVPPATTDGQDTSAAFTAALDTASAEQRPDADMGPRREHTLAVA